MKALSLATPYLIVVVGVPGAGKTVFARRFASMFHVPLISEDQLYQLDPNITPSVAHKLAPNLLEALLPEYLKTNQTIIIDGIAAMRTMRTDLQKLAKQTGYKLQIVWVQTDPITARRRCVRPAKDSDKVPMTSEEYDDILHTFSAPHPSENCLVLSGKHTYATQARTLLRKLTETRPVATQPTKRPSTGSRISIS